MHWVGFAYYGWFACGAIFYEYSKSRSVPVLLLAIIIGALTAGLIGFSEYGIAEMAAFGAVICLFLISATSQMFQSARSNRVLVLFGFISYPLYLVHNNIVIGLTKLIHVSTPRLPDYLVPPIPIAVLTLVAFLVAKYAEPILRRGLKVTPLAIESLVNLRSLFSSSAIFPGS
jgi:peptidoglycan/LPS O-acetylase OafA/YrhL